MFIPGEVNTLQDNLAEPPSTRPPAPTPTDDQLAYSQLVRGDLVEQDEVDYRTILPASGNTFAAGPHDETSAFREDVQTRPDEPDIDAYTRVPVGQFGAALLRGMGWTPGTAASRSGRAGLTSAYVPNRRPAMLGIGAKEMAQSIGAEKDTNGNSSGKGKHGRDDLRFVPLVKRERIQQNMTNVSSLVTLFTRPRLTHPWLALHRLVLIVSQMIPVDRPTKPTRALGSFRGRRARANVRHSQSRADQNTTSETAKHTQAQDIAQVRTGTEAGVRGGTTRADTTAEASATTESKRATDARGKQEHTASEKRGGRTEGEEQLVVA